MAVATSAVVVSAIAVWVWLDCISAVAVRVWAYEVGLRRASIVWVELSGVRVLVIVRVGLRYGVAEGNVGVSVMVNVLVLVGLLVQLAFILYY